MIRLGRGAVARRRRTGIGSRSWATAGLVRLCGPDIYRMKRSRARGWVSLRYGAAAIVLFQQIHVLHAQMSNPPPVADPRAATPPKDAGGAGGILEGMVTLACAPGAVDCGDRPYHVELFVQEERTGTLPTLIYASPRFWMRLAPGNYTISSADARSWWNLPILKPITVVIRPRGVTHVDVRFVPGPEIPRQ
jgi:hypothetical protein